MDIRSFFGNKPTNQQSVAAVAADGKKKAAPNIKSAAAAAAVAVDSIDSHKENIAGTADAPAIEPSAAANATELDCKPSSINNALPDDLKDFVTWQPGEAGNYYLPTLPSVFFCDIDVDHDHHHHYDGYVDAVLCCRAVVPYLALVRTFDEVSQVSGRIDKENLFEKLFRAVMVTSPGDLDVLVYLASNQVSPVYDGLELGIGDSLLVKAVCEATGRKREAVQEDYEKEGDLVRCNEMDGQCR